VTTLTDLPESIPTSPSELQALRERANRWSHQRAIGLVGRYAAVLGGLGILLVVAVFVGTGQLGNVLITAIAFCFLPLSLICAGAYVLLSGNLKQASIIFGRVVSAKREYLLSSHHCQIELTQSRAFNILANGALAPCSKKSSFRAYDKLFDACDQLTPGLEVRLLCSPTGEVIDVLPIKQSLDRSTDSSST
jgi:hypothetical protein